MQLMLGLNVPMMATEHAAAAAAGPTPPN